MPFIRAAFSKVSVPRADNKHVASHFEPSVLRQRAKREIDGFGAELSQEMPTADRRRSDPMSWRPFRTIKAPVIKTGIGVAKMEQPIKID